MGDLSLSDIKFGGIRVQILTAAEGKLRVSVQSRSAVRPFRNSPESSKHHRPLVRSVLEVKPASPSLDRCERDAAQES